MLNGYPPEYAKKNDRYSFADDSAILIQVYLIMTNAQEYTVHSVVSL